MNNSSPYFKIYGCYERDWADKRNVSLYLKRKKSVSIQHK